jgi:hypothetical protein
MKNTANNNGVTAMNPPGFIEENRSFLNRLFSGEMQTTLVVCHQCSNIHITEKGPSPEFASTTCPFCGASRAESIEFTSENIEEHVDELKSKVREEGILNELSDKIKRVMLDSNNQRFNVAACEDCNNRFVFLDEDSDEMNCCAFCASPIDNMRALVDYEDVPAMASKLGPAGFDHYIGRLFYLKLTSGVEDNFELTDVDPAFQRLRFVSPTDTRMAFWVADREIVSMLEFVRIDQMPPEE